MILGIDESGRGPVIGPMVICGYLVEDSRIEELRNAGAKDSKTLARGARKRIAPELKKIASDLMVLKIAPKEIDSSNINKLEIEKFQHIINALCPDKVIIDSPEVNTANFSKKIKMNLNDKKIDIISENYADRKYPEVGAASIIAKVERDNEISRLHKIHGHFGSGYPSDEITIRFLKDWVKKNKEFPDFVRKSWMTIQNIISERKQTNVKRFLNESEVVL